MTMLHAAQNSKSENDLLGLPYKFTSEGRGKSPKATDIGVVDYRGALINGRGVR